MTGTVPRATANPGVPWIAGKPCWLWVLPRLALPSCWRFNPCWAPLGLSEVSWIHLHTSKGSSSSSPTSLLAQHSPLGRSHQGTALDVAGLPAGLEPGTCFSPASIARAVARPGRGWSRAEPDFPAARASIKEGDLFCSWQASPLITQSLQMQDVHRERTWG